MQNFDVIGVPNGETIRVQAVYLTNPSISRRDYFAGLTFWDFAHGDDEEEEYREKAKIAVKKADALIAALDAKQEPRNQDIPEE